MSGFKVGEIAIYVGPAAHGVQTPFENTDVEILSAGSPFKERERLYFASAQSIFPNEVIYCVRWQDGDVGSVPGCKLRKRRPPETYKGQFAPYDKSFNQTIKELGYREEPLEETMKRVNENMAGG